MGMPRSSESGKKNLDVVQKLSTTPISIKLSDVGYDIEIDNEKLDFMERLFEKRERFPPRNRLGIIG